MRRDHVVPSADRCASARWRLRAAAAGATTDAAAGITVDKEKRTVTIAAKVAPRKLDDPKFKEIYPIEVIATLPVPQGQEGPRDGRHHRRQAERRPQGAGRAWASSRASRPRRPRTSRPGPEVQLFLEIPPGKAASACRSSSSWSTRRPSKPMPKVKWLFTGSAMVEAGPGQAGGLRRRRDRHADRHLPGDGRDGVPDEPDDEGREVREAGDERQAAEGGHGGEPGDRGARKRSDRALHSGALPDPWIGLGGEAGEPCVGHDRLLGCRGGVLSLEGCSSGSWPVTLGTRATSSAAGRRTTRTKKEEAGEPFELPDDSAGQLLGQVLPPRTQAGDAEPRRSPRAADGARADVRGAGRDAAGGDGARDRACRRRRARTCCGRGW